MCCPSSTSCSYDDPEIALQCGQMFRDCIRHEAVARLVLDSHIFPAMFGKLELSNFEVASGEQTISLQAG